VNNKALFFLTQYSSESSSVSCTVVAGVNRSEPSGNYTHHDIAQSHVIDASFPSTTVNNKALFFLTQYSSGSSSVSFSVVAAVNRLDPSGNYTHHQFSHPVIVRSDRGTVTSYALYGSQNLQKLSPHPTLTDWPLEPKRSVYCAVRAETSNTVQVNFRFHYIF
jgi:hypothetical protein